MYSFGFEKLVDSQLLDMNPQEGWIEIFLWQCILASLEASSGERTFYYSRKVVLGNSMNAVPAQRTQERIGVARVTQLPLVHLFPIKSQMPTTK